MAGRVQRSAADEDGVLSFVINGALAAAAAESRVQVAHVAQDVISCQLVRDYGTSAMLPNDAPVTNMATKCRINDLHYIRVV